MSEEKKRPNRKISAGEQEGTPPEWAPVNLLETMAGGISVQDLDMRIRYANAAIRRDFGDDIIGKHCFEAYERRAEQCDGCPVRECLATGRPATAQRVGFDKRGKAWFADIVATPLRNQSGEIVGAVETARNVTERKLIEQETDRRNRETAALAEIAMALNSNVELDDILAVALEHSVNICGAVGGLIRLLDEESGLLVTRAWHTTDNQPILEEILPPQKLGDGIIGHAAQTSQILIVDDLRQAPEISATAHGKGLLKLGLNAIIIIPLTSKDKIFGTLALGSFEPGKFRQADKGLLSAIAGQIAVSVESARLLQATRADSENAKARSRADLEHILNSLPVGIHMYDHGGRFVYANAAFNKMTGGIDYLGKTVDEIFSTKQSCMTEQIRDNILRSLDGATIKEGYLHPVDNLWMNVRYLPVIRDDRRHCLIITEVVSEDSEPPAVD